MNSFIFPCTYVGSFELKSCVADENVVDCQEIGEILSIVISNNTGITTNIIVTGMLLDLFSLIWCSIPQLINSTSELKIRVIWKQERWHHCRHSRVQKHHLWQVGNWYVHIDDADNVFRVWNEFAFDGNFWNWKALVWYLISFNFHTYTILEFWRCFFDAVCAIFGVG